MEKRLIRIDADGKVMDDIIDELNNILLKQQNADSKVYLESKEDIKKRLGRSPDYADCIMFRMIWLVKDTEEKMDTITGVYSMDEAYDSILC